MKRSGIIVGVNINDSSSIEESMIELENLCHACEIEVVAHITQNLKKVNAKYYIGTGKIEELSYLVNAHNVDLIIFKNELSATQIKNIEGVLRCGVIDRTALILDIFAERAKTREAKLQVEVARLQYELPRLIGANSNLGRQSGSVGASSGGVGTKSKGVGEKKLELDRRKVEEKITDLNKELETLKNQRWTQRGKRRKSKIPNVALVGYTNAGKSTIMNQFVERYELNQEKKVFEKDMLFATLETSVRRIKLPTNKVFLLSDTVGFVSDLPHDLVKAFRSTLEEVCEADLLLHVVDISNPHYLNHIQVTEDTLKQIGAEHIPTLNVYNKVDLAEDYHASPEGIYISAKKSIGIDKLITTIGQKIFADYKSLHLLMPYDKGNLIAYINQNCEVISKDYTEQGVVYEIECDIEDYNQLKDYELVEVMS